MIQFFFGDGTFRGSPAYYHVNIKELCDTCSKGRKDDDISWKS